MRKNKSENYFKLVYKELIEIHSKLNDLDLKISELDLKLSIKDILDKKTPNKNTTENVDFYWYKDI